jgi:hypothetical protein
MGVEWGAEYLTIICLESNVEVKAPVCPLVGPNASRERYMILPADSDEKTLGKSKPIAT